MPIFFLSLYILEYDELFDVILLRGLPCSLLSIRCMLQIIYSNFTFHMGIWCLKFCCLVYTS